MPEYGRLEGVSRKVARLNMSEEEKELRRQFKIEQEEIYEKYPPYSHMRNKAFMDLRRRYREKGLII